MAAEIDDSSLALESALGAERFQLRRRLGAGGMGVVYEAFDRRRGTVVALKTLRDLDGAALFRFKSEFRGLADLVHPNLVTLYELLSLGDEWVFTMQRVEGVHFIDYVRPTPDPGDEPPTVGPTDEETVRLSDPAIPVRPSQPRPRKRRRGPLKLDRLRVALPQLALGVHALHQAGKLHRDIKPNNVLVTQDAHVFVCDFGLITEFHRGPSLEGGGVRTSDGAGTPLYMSPEQGMGSELNEASDWYSVGILLYEALTGRVPFEGDAADVLQRKRLTQPPPPSELAEGVPPDLDALCLDLLWPEPARRLSGAEVFQRLGVVPPARTTTAWHQAPFVGRETELALLRDALRASRQRAQVVLLNGPSGMGKTAVAQRFLNEVEREGSARVLASRCYENEAMPYKAVDGLVDALATHLVPLSREELDALLPADAPALARLFPVLRRVEDLAAPPTRSLEALDPQALRQRAFRALRQLLRGLARTRPLVLCIDDLQWGDSDSAALLGEVLRPPDAPPLLLVGTYRSDDASHNPLVNALREVVGHGASWELPLQPFTPEEGLRLVNALMPGRAGEAETLVQDAKGHPLWLNELALYGGREAVAAAAPVALPATLETMLRERLGQLPGPARALLDVISVAGRPIDRALAAGAAGLGEEESAALMLLRSQRLLRGLPEQDDGARELLEAYHDRIREVARDVLEAPRQRDIHRRLAQALESLGDGNAESSVQHWLAAGEPRRALVYAEKAAAQATRALAFDRAARLYRLALELTEAGSDSVPVLQAQLADALANAGRGLEAAAAYQKAAQQASPEQVLVLRQRAGEQLLHSGQVDRGIVELQAVLAGMGLRVPATPTAAVFSFVWGRTRLALRGLRFVERSEAQVDPLALRRTDLCWSIYAGMSFVNWALGAAFQTHQLRLALQAGEPKRVARALATEASLLAAISRRGSARGLALHARAMAMAVKTGDPYTLAIAHGTLGLIHYCGGRWGEAGELSERAAHVLRTECTGAAWEQANAELFSGLCLLMRGELKQLSQRVPRWLAETAARGDVYAEANLVTQLGYAVTLARGDNAGARLQVRDALKRWNAAGFYFQRYFQVAAESRVDLYDGDGAGARARLAEIWPALVRNQALRVQLLRVPAYVWRSTAALAALESAGADVRALTAEAAHFGRLLDRESAPWAQGFGRLNQAALARQRGDEAGALSALAGALRIFEAERMGLLVAAVRWRRGQLLGGEQGATELTAAESWLREQTVQTPARMVAMWAPGFSLR